MSVRDCPSAGAAADMAAMLLAVIALVASTLGFLALLPVAMMVVVGPLFGPLVSSISGLGILSTLVLVAVVFGGLILACRNMMAALNVIDRPDWRLLGSIYASSAVVPLIIAGFLSFGSL